MNTYTIRLTYRLHFQGSYSQESHTCEVKETSPEWAQVKATLGLLGFLGGVDQIRTEVIA